MTRLLNPRARFLGALAAVAVGASLFAIVFRGALSLVYRNLYHASNVVEAMAGLPWWLRLGVPAAGGFLAGGLARLKASPRQGVSNVMEAVALGNVRLSLRSTVVRLASSWTAIATGMSIGREGPLIEFGGSLGAAAGRLVAASHRHVRVLVAAGTAAGFAAAYNTPFAAVLFILETIIGIAALEAVLPCIGATVIASTLTRAVVGGGPIYGQRAFVLDSSWDLLSFAVLGVVGAIGAAVFKRVLGLFETLLEHHPVPQPWRAALGGLVVGLIAVWVPEVAGNGYEPLNLLLDGRMMTGILAILFVAKMAATSGSVASGVPGGIFTPVLLSGGILGVLWAHAAMWLGLTSQLGIGSHALVGMAATTAASIHAPLTAAVLVFELSGDYAIVLPLLAVTTVSTALSRAFGETSVYQAELERRGLAWELTLDGRARSDD